MRIAHVTDCFRPRVGGIELHVDDLARHQRAAGHDVTVLTSTPGETGSAVRRFASLGGDLPSPAGLADLRRALIEAGFDVVHAHTSSVSPFAWSALRAATASGIPAAVTLHSMLSPRARALRLSADLTGWSTWPVAWAAVSAAAAAPLRAVLGDGVTVLPNGIDAGAWVTPAPRSANRPLTIVSVMRLSRRKRPRSLIRILAGIRARIDPAVPLRAVVVGDGPERAGVERLLRSAGMDGWVTLTGALTREQVRDVLTRSDVYLAPAHRESFGIAALEARCAGLPVLAMASGGVGEFVRDGVEGFLVGSDAEMARVTARLLTSSLIRGLQEHNRTTRPALDWPETVERTLSLYHRASVLAGVATGDLVAAR